MADTPERRVKKRAVAVLIRYAAYWFYPVTGGFGRSGVPDIIACCNGYFIAIECKAGKNQPSALQSANLTKIGDAGGFALVINETNVDMLEELLVRLHRGQGIHDPDYE